MNQLSASDIPAEKTSARTAALDEKCGRDAERNQIGERIKFASKRAFDAAHARDTTVEQIKNAR